MNISALELFRIGIGPSSSHTVGPMRAAHDFAATLAARAEGGRVERIVVELFGSLSATGLGHGTDRAVLAGLMGETPESADPDALAPRVAAVRHGGRLPLGGTRFVRFDVDRDLLFRAETLPRHPNALRIRALAADGGVLYANTYYSVGGGFVLDEASDGSTQEDVALPYGFDTAAELLELCRRNRIGIARLMLDNETAWRSEAATRAALQEVWRVMQACVARGLSREGVLPGGLNVPRRAAALHRRLLEEVPSQSLIARTFSGMDWVNLYALAVNEENAAGGRMVTAPTNGAAGIIPAVLHYYMRFQSDSGERDVVDFLLAAAAIGILCKKNASISGAEVGCQGEVGSACAMAAAGLAQGMGGSPHQIENAAEIALEHNLGLTCDPIGGLVQIPCIERNAIAAVKAINAAQMALRGDGQHQVSLDKVIRTMRETGRDMHSKYKETSRGGLAVSFVEC
ncbi:MAG: L-serine ammonia-lyase [Rhodocyclaceae bacterium]|nr:L-serine ammonia-lyase [Rhodocyclaceae bacterium]